VRDRSRRTRTTVPSRIRRTIGSAPSERLFQAPVKLAGHHVAPLSDVCLANAEMKEVAN
jgi:hypothetical protein